MFPLARVPRESTQVHQDGQYVIGRPTLELLDGRPSPGDGTAAGVRHGRQRVTHPVIQLPDRDAPAEFHQGMFQFLRRGLGVQAVVVEEHFLLDRIIGHFDLTRPALDRFTDLQEREAGQLLPKPAERYGRLRAAHVVELIRTILDKLGSDLLSHAGEVLESDTHDQQKTTGHRQRGPGTRGPGARRQRVLSRTTVAAWAGARGSGLARTVRWRRTWTVCR